jgi:hypothetical protein
MRQYFLLKLSFACLMLGSWLPLSGQEVEDALSAYTGENSTAYAQPLGDALEAGLNSGFYYSADIPKMGFSLQIGLTAMFALIPDDARTYPGSIQGNFQPSELRDSYEAPTIFGKGESVQLEGEGGTRYSFPGGIELRSLPLAVPQVKIGGLLGTDLTLRYFATDLDETLGSLNFFGFGLRHSISQYLPDAFPLDLAVGYYSQSLSIDNLLETQTSLINAQASFRTGPLFAYTGLGYSTGDTQIDYAYDDGDIQEEIFIDLEQTTNLRALLGVALQLGPLYLQTDYNLGNINVWNVGLGFSFGQ